MTRGRTPHGLWPAPSTEALLRAAIDLDPARARAAFLAWHAPSAALAPEALPSSDRRLLPLVRARLTAQGFSHPRLDACAAFVERAAAQVRRILAATAEAVGLLDAAGVPSLALKGIVLVCDGTYEDPAHRPMSDVDLLVRPADLGRALATLARAGFLGRPVSPRLRPYLSAFEVDRARDGVQIDLHQYLIEYGAPPAAERDLWRRARPISLAGGARALGTAPEDLLSHICLAALKFGRTRNSRWVVDAAAILRRRGAALDWDAVVRDARRRRVTRPLAECLSYLVDAFALPVPEDAILALERAPVRGRDRRLYGALAVRPATLGEVLRQQRALYEFGAEAAGLARGPLAFAEFAARHLVHWWRVESLAHVPLEAARRLARLVAPGRARRP